MNEYKITIVIEVDGHKKFMLYVYTAATLADAVYDALSNECINKPMTRMEHDSGKVWKDGPFTYTAEEGHSH